MRLLPNSIFRALLIFQLQNTKRSRSNIRTVPIKPKAQQTLLNKRDGTIKCRHDGKTIAEKHCKMSSRLGHINNRNIKNLT